MQPIVQMEMFWINLVVRFVNVISVHLSLVKFFANIALQQTKRDVRYVVVTLVLHRVILLVQMATKLILMVVLFVSVHNLTKSKTIPEQL